MSMIILLLSSRKTFIFLISFQIYISKTKIRFLRFKVDLSGVDTNIVVMWVDPDIATPDQVQIYLLCE